MLAHWWPSFELPAHEPAVAAEAALPAGPQWPSLEGPPLDLAAIAASAVAPVPSAPARIAPTRPPQSPLPSRIQIAQIDAAPAPRFAPAFEAQSGAVAVLDRPAAPRPVRRIVIEPRAFDGQLAELPAVGGADPAPPPLRPPVYGTAEPPPHALRPPWGARTLLWILAGALLLAFALIALTRLGGGSSRSPRSEAAAVAATRASAAAINLAPADVPGLAAQPPGVVPVAGPGSVAWRCLNTMASLPTGTETDSPNFAGGGELGMQEVSSVVIAMPSAAAAANVIAVARQGRVEACIAEALAVGGAAGALTGVSGATFSTPLRGSADAIALRTRATLTAGGASAPIEMYFRAYAVGREVLILTTVGIGRPFPNPAAARLGALLTARALAHPVG